MSLSDLQSALNMRDLIYTMVGEMVERLRPEVKIGKVYSYDSVQQTARILFAGETIQNLVLARFGKQNTPRTEMITTYESQGYAAAGDIVRVSGKPGSYYITDFVSGGPESWYTGEIGTVKMWLGPTAPVDHLQLNGTSFLGSDYPILASIVGDGFGTHNGDIYWLPDFRSRSPMGLGPLDIDSVFNMTRGLKWGDHRMQAHIHTPSNGGNFVANGFGGVGGANITTGGGGYVLLSETTSTGSGTQQNIHPVLGVNMIVRAR